MTELRSEERSPAMNEPPSTDAIPASEAASVANVYFMSHPSPMSVLTTDGYYVQVNATWEAWNGKYARDVVGRSLYDVWPKTAADRAVNLCNTVVLSKKKLQITEPQINDNREAWIRTTFFPLPDANNKSGNIVGIGVTTEDVSDIMYHFRARRDVMESEAEQQRIVGAAHCMIWSAEVTEVGHPDYLFWQNSFPETEFAQMFFPLDLQDDESYEAAWHRCRLKPDRISCDLKGTSSIRAGRNYSQEFRVSCSGNEIRWAREEVNVETVVPSKVWRAVGVVTEITERKLREAEIEELNERLRRAMRETHHRVKNNLQVITALVEMQVEPDDKVVPIAAMKRIGHYVSSLATMHDLLTHESHEHPTEDHVSIQAVLDQLSNLLSVSRSEGQLRTRSVDIRVTTQMATSLALLISELVSNGFKHGGERVDVTLEWEPRRQDEEQTGSNGRGLLRVLDNGPGFPEGFDPRMHSGTGLDLARSLGEWDLNGRFTFANLLDGGASVTMEFPCHVSA